MSNFNYITSQEQNRQKPVAALEEVAYVEVMDAMGNPRKITPESLNTNPTDFNEQVNQKLEMMIERTAALEDLQRDFGQYEALPDVVLSVVHEGKRYNSEGRLVADANWNVGRLGAVVVGNTYELFMESSEKMVLGTALFVAHTTETNGDNSRDEYTPLYYAKDTRVPSKGYVCLEAMESYDDVLVCYRNDVSGANQIRVRRYGTKASIATQINNLKADVDLKSFADGYYAGMRVGNSDALTPNGDNAPVYEEILTAGRMVNDAPDLMGGRVPSATSVSNISIKEMRGDVFGGNQMVENYDFKTTKGWLISFGTKELVEDGIHLVGGLLSACRKPYTAKDYTKHFLIADIKSIEGVIKAYIGDYSSSKDGDVTISKAGSFCVVCQINPAINKDNRNIGIVASSGNTDVTVRAIMSLDLTTLFPTDTAFVNSLGQNDALKVMHRLSFFAYERDAQGNAVQLEDETLRIGAETIAKLGYMEPKLCTGTWGVLNVIDGNTGRIKQSIDRREAKTKIWRRLLAALAEQGIDTSAEWCQKPFEASINENVGIKWDFANKCLYVNAWMVDLGSLNYLRISSNETTTKYRSTTKILFSTQYGGGTKLPPCVIQGYTIVSVADMDAANTDYAITLRPYTNQEYVYITNSVVKSSEELKTAMNGVILLYELATPIRIDFDEDMNINMVDVKPYDLYALDDIDGEPMYDIKIEPQESGKIRTTIAPKAEWVEEHKQLPVGIHSTIVGLGTQVNYDFVMNMYKELQELKNRQ